MIFKLASEIGNFTIDARSSPMLFDALVQAAKMVNIGTLFMVTFTICLGS